MSQFDNPPHRRRDVESRDSADARRCDDEAGRLRTVEREEAPSPGRDSAFKIDRDRFVSEQARRSHSSPRESTGNTRFPRRDRFAPETAPTRGRTDVRGRDPAGAQHHASGTAVRLSAAVWKGFAAGAVSEADAQALAEAIEARKAVPAAPAQPRRVGSRPRSPESMERRRRWTSSGWLPPQLAARFTMAENAVLSVVAAEVSRRGQSMLTIGAIAGHAGVCKATVRSSHPSGRGPWPANVRGVAHHGLAQCPQHRSHRQQGMVLLDPYASKARQHAHGGWG